MRFAFLFFIAVLLFPFGAWAADVGVEKIRFGQHPDKIRAVIELSKVENFRVFALADPYRLVIDLPRFEWRVGAVTKPNNIGVSHIRHGALKDGVSRIVFEMDHPAVVKAAFMLRESAGIRGRLVLDFKSATFAEFQAQKGKSFGTLGVDILQPHSDAVRIVSQNSGVVKPPKIPLTEPKIRPKPRKKKPLIVIDPGHGGKDPGAVGAGKLYEKKVVLALAKELKKQLEASGRYRVKLTRDRDVYIRLYDRVKIARRHGADLFVSIHADSIANKNVRGASVYTLSEKASDAQSAKLAARENQSDIIAGVDLSVEDKDVANILMDLAMRDTMNQSNFFANKMVSQLSRKGVRVLDHSHRSAGFAVLKAPDVPSILIEVGFMSNRKEASMLSKPSYRKKVASAIKSGIGGYFDYVARNAN